MQTAPCRLALQCNCLWLARVQCTAGQLLLQLPSGCATVDANCTVLCVACSWQARWDRRRQKQVGMTITHHRELVY